MTSRGAKTAGRHSHHFPNSYTSDGYMASSTNDDIESRFGDDELMDEEAAAEEEEEEYMGLVSAWDRTDHVLYPGPLCQGTTLKHDVQAFLRGKVEDIQDRMPVDWDSAGLLLSYLELLVKNNGVRLALFSIIILDSFFCHSRSLYVGCSSRRCGKPSNGK